MTALALRPNHELTVEEVTELERREAVIQQAEQVRFLIIGRELTVIRNAKLYLATHQTFEEYIEIRWDFSRAHAYRMIDAAAIADSVSPARGHSLTTEMQARELAKAPTPEIRQQSWDTAVEQSNGKAPKATEIAKIVDQKTAENASVEPEIIDAEHEPMDRTIGSRNATNRLDAAVRAYQQAANRIIKARQELADAIVEKAAKSREFDNRLTSFQKQMDKITLPKDLTELAEAMSTKWENAKKQLSE